MVTITPYDPISDPDCRWEIKGWGLVFGKDLEKELKAYYREEEPDEEASE